MIREKLKKCPVCKRKFLKQGLRNHIICSAESEAFTRMKGLFEYHKKDFKNVSRAVLLRNMPHFSYYRKNYKLTNNRKLYV